MAVAIVAVPVELEAIPAIVIAALFKAWSAVRAVVFPARLFSMRQSTILAMPSHVVLVIVAVLDALLRMRQQSEQVVQAVCAGEGSSAEHQHSKRRTCDSAVHLRLL